MRRLSFGAMLAWQVAAGETVAGGHKFIGREHLLIGVCSLGKLLRSNGAGFQPQAYQALLAEGNAVASALRGCGLRATRMRRLVRKGIGRGNYDHTGLVISAPVSRND